MAVERILRSTAIRSSAEARISALRTELTGTRRRNEELVAEVDRLVAERSSWWRAFRRVTGLQPLLDRGLGRARLDLRRSAAMIPPPVRRQIGRSGRVLWWTVTLQLPQRFRMWRAHRTRRAGLLGGIMAEQPPAPSRMLPSAHFRQQDPAWVAPHLRPDFIRLSLVTPTARIAVALHLFYAELWPEMRQALDHITQPFDLFVSLVAGASEQAASDILAAFPSAHIIVVDNHGRDILPFLQLARSGVLFRYDFVCKVHGKRTTWRTGGDAWRRKLIAGVLGSADTITRILDAFRNDPDLGLVVADGQMFTGREFWAANEARLRVYFDRLGLKPSSFEQSFCGGSVFWIRPFLLRPIDALNLSFDDFELEPIPVDGATVHCVERLVSLSCHDAGMRIEQTGDLGFAVVPRPSGEPAVRLIANYLPQFHPIPENDAWWGPGFTEWTNVTRARPLFAGHRQPRLPADLGFYDLRLPETRQAQADLARQYGIHGFCYYYYWFNGRRLLERPLADMLASGVPDFPFMICWANEPWTRNWDGMAKEVLVGQDYPIGWERAFAADIAPLMRDPRYIRINGRPMLALYRTMQIPDSAEAMRRLRAYLADAGVPDVHLIGGWLQFGNDPKLPAHPGDLGLDAYFEFPPHKMARRPMAPMATAQFAGAELELNDYNDSVDAAIDEMATGNPSFHYRGVMGAWDNTPRRGRAMMVMHGATPTSFRRWLRATVNQARLEAQGPETAVFINAWNEWAEGANLEPDQTFGHGWLEAVASVTVREPPLQP